MKNNPLRMHKKIESCMLPLDRFIGFIIPVTPKTKKMLKIFEPITFPTAISFCFFIVAITEVTSSGREVPTDAMVKPIILSSILKACAMSIAEFTTNVPPSTIAPRLSRMHMLISSKERGLPFSVASALLLSRSFNDSRI